MGGLWQALPVEKKETAPFAKVPLSGKVKH
jgi:hypothetical protein